MSDNIKAVELTDEQKAELCDVLYELTDREARVLELRYGLLDNHPRTYEEVAKEFGTTEDAIVEIETKAIKKLQHPKRSK